MCNVPCCEELLVYKVHALVQVQGILLHISDVQQLLIRVVTLYGMSLSIRLFCSPQA